MSTALQALLHLAVLLPALLLLTQCESALRDQQWAYSSVEDRLVSYTPDAQIPAGTWAHLSGPPELLPANDPEFGLTVPGALKLSRRVEYCQWVEHAHENCRTVRGNDGESHQECTTSYSYSREWQPHLVPSAGFREPGHRNPSYDPFPARKFRADRTLLSGMEVEPTIVDSLMGATRQKLDLTAVQIDPASQAAQAGFHSDVVNGRAVFRHRNRSDNFWDSRGSCLPGDIRVTWEFEAPESVTVIGAVGADRRIVPIQTDRAANHLVGIMHAGHVSAKMAFSDRLHWNQWYAILMRLVLMALMVGESYIWSRQLGLWWASTRLFAGLVLATGLLCGAVVLGGVWCWLYGLSDWRGMDTSAPQLWLLMLASSALLVLGIASQQNKSSVVTSLARISVRLHRVSDSLFSIDGPTPVARTSSALDVLRVGGLVAGMAAGVLLSVAALAGGGSDHYWIAWSIGSLATASSLVLVLATVITKERLAAPRAVGQQPDGVTTSMDCPVCLESVPACEGLVLAPCGHTLCASCFEAMSASSLRGKCPVCRAGIESTITLSSQEGQDSDEFRGHFQYAN